MDDEPGGLLSSPAMVRDYNNLRSHLVAQAAELGIDLHIPPGTRLVSASDTESDPGPPDRGTLLAPLLRQAAMGATEPYDPDFLIRHSIGFIRNLVAEVQRPYSALTILTVEGLLTTILNNGLLDGPSHFSTIALCKSIRWEPDHKIELWQRYNSSEQHTNYHRAFAEYLIGTHDGDDEDTPLDGPQFQGFTSAHSLREYHRPHFLRWWLNRVEGEAAGGPPVVRTITAEAYDHNAIEIDAAAFLTTGLLEDQCDHKGQYSSLGLAPLLWTGAGPGDIVVIHNLPLGESGRLLNDCAGRVVHPTTREKGVLSVQLFHWFHTCEIPHSALLLVCRAIRGYPLHLPPDAFPLRTRRDEWITTRTPVPSPMNRG